MHGVLRAGMATWLGTPGLYDVEESEHRQREAHELQRQTRMRQLFDAGVRGRGVSVDSVPRSADVPSTRLRRTPIGAPGPVTVAVPQVNLATARAFIYEVDAGQTEDPQMDIIWTPRGRNGRFPEFMNTTAGTARGRVISTVGSTGSDGAVPLLVDLEAARALRFVLDWEEISPAHRRDGRNQEAIVFLWRTRRRDG